MLVYLRQSRGFDTGYNRSYLSRRLQQRMQMVKIDRYSDYVNYLKEHLQEFNQLFNTIEINVTSCFRDTEAWNYLVNEVIPPLATSKPASESIRVWSAGYASGEEAYILAIVFAQTLRAEKFQQRVRIYAKDVDTEAVNQARFGTYLSEQVMEISPTLLSQYFEQAGNSKFCHRHVQFLNAARGDRAIL